MDWFCVVFFMVATLLSSAQSFLMIVMLFEGETAMYAIIEPTVLNGDNWAFAMKSSLSVNKGVHGKIGVDFSSWKNTEGRDCNVRFIDESKEDPITRVPDTSDVLLGGKISNVKFEAGCTITIKISHEISIAPYKTQIGACFNGFRSNGMSGILLTFPAIRENELLTLFKDSFSAHVELMDGEKKQQILMQSVAMTPKTFQDITFLLFKCRTVLETKGDNFEMQGNVMLTVSKCNVKLVTTVGEADATGIINFVIPNGTMWIQSAGNDEVKSDVDTIQKANELTASVLEYRISLPQLKQSETNGVDWTMVRIIQSKFDSFTKKLVVEFDVGEMVSINWNGSTEIQATAYINTMSKVLTLFEMNLTEFEDVRQGKSEFEVKILDYVIVDSFQAAPNPITKIFLNPTIQGNTGTDNVLQYSFKQYFYFSK